MKKKSSHVGCKRKRQKVDQDKASRTTVASPKKRRPSVAIDATVKSQAPISARIEVMPTQELISADREARRPTSKGRDCESQMKQESGIEDEVISKTVAKVKKRLPAAKTHLPMSPQTEICSDVEVMPTQELIGPGKKSRLPSKGRDSVSQMKGDTDIEIVMTSEKVAVSNERPSAAKINVPIALQTKMSADVEATPSQATNLPSRKTLQFKKCQDFRRDGKRASLDEGAKPKSSIEVSREQPAETHVEVQIDFPRTMPVDPRVLTKQDMLPAEKITWQLKEHQDYERERKRARGDEVESVRRTVTVSKKQRAAIEVGRTVESLETMPADSEVMPKQKLSFLCKKTIPHKKFRNFNMPIKRRIYDEGERRRRIEAASKKLSSVVKTMSGAASSLPSKLHVLSRSSMPEMKWEKNGCHLEMLHSQQKLLSDMSKTKFVFLISTALGCRQAEYEKFWGQIMFVRKCEYWRPVLVLGPHLIPPQRRLKWMSTLGKVSNMHRLLYPSHYAVI